MKAPSNFSEYDWKECPDNVDGTKKYSVEKKNSKIVTQIIIMTIGVVMSIIALSLRIRLF